MWLVAEEHDEQALSRLGRALRHIGGSPASETWGVGGSQELGEWRVTLPNGNLIVTVETFMGLTVEGPTILVAQLRETYRAIAAR